MRPRWARLVLSSREFLLPGQDYRAAGPFTLGAEAAGADTAPQADGEREMSERMPEPGL
ncbi:hypothetical protein HMPREF9056_00289 [Actinomyces sp. oral taxon 170 str. F0386]|nr:hypothetical protein HMPREF9056_00289 [Actinomyces sp. oral taxon 170 str. F0386]